MPGPLDNPAHASLTGAHAHLALRCGDAVRYPADMSPFVALPDAPGPGAFDELAKLVGPGGLAMSASVALRPPPDWEVVRDRAGVQLVAGPDLAGLAAAARDADVAGLGPADVPEMLDLAGRTRPGPFLPRTVEFGGYLGIRDAGRLVAMAGERLHPPGFAEISAVCTDPAYRGQGLATRLTLAAAAAILGRGETPFLHAVADNVTAIRLYESIGFEFRRAASFMVLRAP